MPGVALCSLIILSHIGMLHNPVFSELDDNFIALLLNEVRWRLPEWINPSLRSSRWKSVERHARGKFPGDWNLRNYRTCSNKFRNLQGESFKMISTEEFFFLSSIFLSIFWVGNDVAGRIFDFARERERANDALLWFSISMAKGEETAARERKYKIRRSARGKFANKWKSCNNHFQSVDTANIFNPFTPNPL